MAKENISKTYNKATITVDENKIFTITEVTKDETLVYNLTDELNRWVGVEGISLTIKQDRIMPSEE